MGIGTTLSNQHFRMSSETFIRKTPSPIQCFYSSKIKCVIYILGIRALCCQNYLLRCDGPNRSISLYSIGSVFPILERTYMKQLPQAFTFLYRSLQTTIRSTHIHTYHDQATPAYLIDIF